ncbi:MAG: hypothetical protein ACREBU_18985, partial [Nitrososphaera sp.]
SVAKTISLHTITTYNKICDPAAAFWFLLGSMAEPILKTSTISGFLRIDINISRKFSEMISAFCERKSQSVT